MNRAIEAYLADLEARSFSHSRRHHSVRTLERLLLYLREAHHVTDWRTVNEPHLCDFAVYAATRHRTPKGKPISATTLRQWLSIIRSFFVWLNLQGHLLHNPTERLAFPRKGQSLPHVLNEADIARLIETPDTTTALGIRDRALMEVLYATGIRHSEAHKLDLYDVDRRIISPFVWAKASAIASFRSRKLPLTGSLVTSLLVVRSSPPACGGARADDVASPNSFPQLPLFGYLSPAGACRIKCSPTASATTLSKPK